jgi:biofilm PGA synthesis N-glycosyltransferase PgaC
MALFLLIFFLLLTAYGFLIDHYRRAWNAIPVYSDVPVPKTLVSIVVAVRNERKNIERLRDCLYRQDYPKELYEIIIVDDHSTDDTEEKFRSFYAEDFSTKYVKLAEGSGSKKAAITTGIRLAAGDLIITTDADCAMGPAWVSTMVSFFSDRNAKFVAAPVIMKSRRSFLGIFQSLDFLSLQGITGASVDKRLHSMCNGANLAYAKEAFIEVNGFEGIDHLPSGDDMLLMHKIYTKYPEQVFYLKNKEAIVTTEPETNWKDFFNQRIRWASKAVHYKDKRIFYVLLLIYLINTCFLALTIAALIHHSWGIFLFLFLLAKIIIEFPFVNAVAIFFGQSSLMVYFPFLQPFHILYTIIAGWLGRFGSYTWKSRVIKNK